MRTGVESKNEEQTEYRYVRKVVIIRQGRHKSMYRASVPQLKKSKSFLTIKEAAIAVDKWLIEAKLEPVNILKRKP